MSKTEAKKHFRFPMFQGILPIQRSRVPGDVIAGITLAALNIPQAMGDTKKDPYEKSYKTNFLYHHCNFHGGFD
jgi:hypothetical protein